MRDPVPSTQERLRELPSLHAASLEIADTHSHAAEGGSMTRQEIREQFNFDYDNTVGDKYENEQAKATLNGAELVACAIMCLAYAVGDLASAVREKWKQ